MESYLVYRVLVSIIVLKKSLAADVPNLNWLISTSTCDACAIRVELNWVNNVLVVIKALNHRLLSDVPKFDSFIIRPRNNKSSVRRELTRANPVGMGINRQLKLSIIYLEHFKCFVIGSWEKQRAITGKSDTLNRSGVALNDFGMALNSIGPNSDSFICRSWSNDLTVGRDCNIINGTTVANKAVRSEGRFEVPHHKSTVQWWTYYLLKIRVECQASNCILVSLKRSLESGIADWGKEFGLDWTSSAWLL
jgi:hypothetical protein